MIRPTRPPEPTSAQWAAINQIFNGGPPFVSATIDAIIDERGQFTRLLCAKRVLDDNLVQTYMIAPDGTYAYEELNHLSSD